VEQEIEEQPLAAENPTKQIDTAIAPSKQSPAISPVVVDAEPTVADDESQSQDEAAAEEIASKSIMNQNEMATKKASLVDDVVIETPVEKEKVETPIEEEETASIEEGSSGEKDGLDQKIDESSAITSSGEPTTEGDVDSVFAQPAVHQAATVESATMPEMKRLALDEDTLKRIKHNRGCYKCDFSSYDLRDLDFEGYDFEGTNFRGADLTGADLRNCKLKDTDFTEALLTKSDLRKADLYKAKLVDANLEKAKTEGMLTDSADLSGIQGYVPNLVEVKQ
jgi:hypothetical protein